MFFDLNVQGNSYEKNIEIANFASNYGWNHINFSYSTEEFKSALKLKEELQDQLKGITIDFTLEIKNKNIKDIVKTTNRFRDKASCISVVGGNLKVNRAVSENIKIDVLSRPYLKRYDSGLNQVLSKELVKNNVAVELCFKDILDSYLSHRAKIISNFKDIYTLYRKFDFPLIISSRASGIFDIRTTKDIEAFFLATGLTNEEFLKSMNQASNILEFNKFRNDYILKGVRRVNNEA